jgi:hypothetical protein
MTPELQVSAITLRKIAHEDSILHKKSFVVPIILYVCPYTYLYKRLKSLID